MFSLTIQAISHNIYLKSKKKSFPKINKLLDSVHTNFEVYPLFSPMILIQRFLRQWYVVANELFNRASLISCVFLNIFQINSDHIFDCY